MILPNLYKVISAFEYADGCWQTLLLPEAFHLESFCDASSVDQFV